MAGVAGAFAPQAFAQPTVPVEVKINAAAKLGALPARGLGFSMEKNLIGIGDLFVPSNTDLIGCCRRLGPQVLRIGGTHVDHTGWEPNGKGGKRDATSAKDIAEFAKFIKLIGWQVVYGLNLAHMKPEDAAQEAAVAARELGPSLLAFEIGNEPDLFVLHSDRPKGYNYETFRGEWMAHANAVNAAVPGAPLSGPGAFGAWRMYGLPFAKDFGSRVKLLTQHYYRANGKKPGATMDALLDGMPALFSEMQGMVQAARVNNIPLCFRMVETNTFVGGGSPGVSDTAVSALWAVEYALRAAEIGVNGLNFQIGPAGHSNTSIAVNGNSVHDMRPEFYGLAMIASIGTGNMLETAVTGAKPRMTAHSFVTQGGNMRFVLNNMDSTTAMRAQVSFGDKKSRAGKALWLTAPAMDSKVGITLGGALIANNGYFKPNLQAVSSDPSGQFEINVPPASAVCVTSV